MHDDETEEITRLEITDTLDLHSFPASEIGHVVEDYLAAALEKGFTELRIFHGRGIGAQRRTVRRVLERHPQVITFSDAPPNAGGWGATIVDLRTTTGSREPS